MHEEPKIVGLSAEQSSRMEQNAEGLIAQRKQTKAPSDYTTKKEVASFKMQKASKMPGVIQAVDQTEDTIIMASMGETHRGITFEGDEAFEYTIEQT